MAAAVLPIELPRGITWRGVSDPFGPTNPWNSGAFIPIDGKRVAVAFTVDSTDSSIVQCNVQWNTRRDGSGSWQVSSPQFGFVSRQTSQIVNTVANGGIGATDFTRDYFTNVPLAGPAFRLSFSGITGTSTGSLVSVHVTVM